MTIPSPGFHTTTKHDVNGRYAHKGVRNVSRCKRMRWKESKIIMDTGERNWEASHLIAFDF